MRFPPRFAAHTPHYYPPASFKIFFQKYRNHFFHAINAIIFWMISSRLKRLCFACKTDSFAFRRNLVGWLTSTSCLFSSGYSSELLDAWWIHRAATGRELNIPSAVRFVSACGFSKWKTSSLNSTTSQVGGGISHFLKLPTRAHFQFWLEGFVSSPCPHVCRLTRNHYRGDTNKKFLQDIVAQSNSNHKNFPKDFVFDGLKQ